MAEVPWFTSPPDAKLVWGHHLRDDLGYLHFIDPEGHRAVVWVSKTNTVEGEQFAGQNVWHIDIPDETPGALVTVSPSIHFIGHFHSPRPVQFRLVDELTGTVNPMTPVDDTPTPTPASDQDPAPLSAPHEQAAGVETDASVLAAGEPEELTASGPMGAPAKVDEPDPKTVTAAGMVPQPIVDEDERAT